ncbi:MAG TPA: TraR/DksA C4-type zinc finger protein [Actinomycetota bacterium]|nr:TraR/DksA C4-type zinc finger protein [Actinomycetota bacterium]
MARKKTAGAEVSLPDATGEVGFDEEFADAGSFGRCEACGGPIEAERLDALPYATLCLADARRRVRLR